MNKKLVKQQRSISMEKFLRNYCRLENDSLIKLLSELSHKELKEIYYDFYKITLLTVPFQHVTVEAVRRGDVLFVSDAYHNPAPYRNPEKKKKDDILFNKITSDGDSEQTEIYDAIEDNFTTDDINISSTYSFDLPKVKTKGEMKK